MKREPTEEQLAALRQFKRINGMAWKLALKRLWLTDRCPPILQQVRNELGPKWLTAWRDQ